MVGKRKKKRTPIFGISVAAASKVFFQLIMTMKRMGNSPESPLLANEAKTSFAHDLSSETDSWEE